MVGQWVYLKNIKMKKLIFGIVTNYVVVVDAMLSQGLVETVTVNGHEVPVLRRNFDEERVIFDSVDEYPVKIDYQKGEGVYVRWEDCEMKKTECRIGINEPNECGVSKNDIPKDADCINNFLENENGRSLSLSKRNLVSSVGEFNNLVLLLRFADHVDDVEVDECEDTLETVGVSKLEGGLTCNDVFSFNRCFQEPEAMTHCCACGGGKRSGRKVMVSRTNDPSDYEIFFNSDQVDDVLAPTGSVKSYYEKQSYGAMNMNNIIVGWIDVSFTEAEAAGGCSALNCVNSYRDAIVEALDKLEDLDLSQFDLDKDGEIDAFTVVHSGYTAEHSVRADQFGTVGDGRVWSHKWVLPEPKVITDKNGFSLRFSPYNTVGANWGLYGKDLIRLGVTSHELGHFFGLIDLYDTNGGSRGVSVYSVMGSSWNLNQLYPGSFDPSSKIDLGWITPLELSSSATLQLPRVQLDGKVLEINQGFPSGEYILIENRGKMDSDKYNWLNDNAVLVWHIDENLNSNANEFDPNSSGALHPRVRLIQADNLYNLENNGSPDSGDDFSLGQTLSDTSNPPLTPYALWSNSGPCRETGNAISVIKFESNTFTLNYTFTERDTAINCSPTSSPTVFPTEYPTPAPTVDLPLCNTCTSFRSGADPGWDIYCQRREVGHRRHNACYEPSDRSDCTDEDYVLCSTIDPLAYCSNGVLDGDETDVDCGGSCGGCGYQKKCMVDSDCLSRNGCFLINIDDKVGSCFQDECVPGLDECGRGNQCSKLLGCVPDLDFTDSPSPLPTTRSPSPLPTTRSPISAPTVPLCPIPCSSYRSGADPTDEIFCMRYDGSSRQGRCYEEDDRGDCSRDGYLKCLKIN